MPRTHGESIVHLNRFDALVMVDMPVAEYLHPNIGEVAERVARYIASIIDDGSTLQIGLGRVPNEALRHLRDRRDLGTHSDVITDGVVDLVEAGVVTGRCKTRYRDRIVASYCVGTRRLYDFVDDNPGVQLLPIDQVCHPEEVARHSRMVSITQAFAIDLTGQVCVPISSEGKKALGRMTGFQWECGLRMAARQQAQVFSRADHLHTCKAR
jgi:acyl-CoA hydrolase